MDKSVLKMVEKSPVQELSISGRFKHFLKHETRNVGNQGPKLRRCEPFSDNFRTTLNTIG